jgi:hypothetical protein
LVFSKLKANDEAFRRSGDLLEEFRRADHLDKKWKVADVLDALLLMTTPRTALRWWFELGKIDVAVAPRLEYWAQKFRRVFKVALKDGASQ